MEDTEIDKTVFYRCDGVNCRKKKGKFLENFIKKYNLKDKVEIENVDCSNRCVAAPVLHLHPEDIWLSEKDLGTVFKKYILNKKPD